MMVVPTPLISITIFLLDYHFQADDNACLCLPISPEARR